MKAYVDKKVVLELTEADALWLRNVMRYPVASIGRKDESDSDKRRRLDMYDLLSPINM